ncbi:hypothetical protein [Thermospira aquatica]|uniref:Uncharacterized protein n=1 Tax=Thermospira aquatica TaxID=2828656 RepID=A0AAX3BFB7_9SPIR|nr:hypothetical protein [Thermospira aquatica]URA10911.1 hypothetical protein KDW03_03670 [Thermospira aquatica]
MSTMYIVTLVILVIILGAFIYYDTRNGFHRAFYRLLRLVLPLVLAGIIVFLVSLISRDSMIRHILGLVLSVIFFLVLSASLRLPEKKTQLDLLNVFLGALIGVVRAWLVIGFALLYLKYFKIFDISTILGASFYAALVKPIEWLLFFSFLR